jgi:hypothetical protein
MVTVITVWVLSVNKDKMKNLYRSTGYIYGKPDHICAREAEIRSKVVHHKVNIATCFILNQISNQQRTA